MASALGEVITVVAVISLVLVVVLTASDVADTRASVAFVGKELVVEVNPDASAMEVDSGVVEPGLFVTVAGAELSVGIAKEEDAGCVDLEVDKAFDVLVLG